MSFLVGSFLLKMDRSEDGDLMDATATMEGMKGKKSVASAALAGESRGQDEPIHDIVFACDAGMGSSAMGASVLRRKIQEAGFDDVTVVNKAISALTDDYDVVVSHQDLTDRAKQKTGSAIHVSVDNFMGSPRYDEIVELLQTTNAAGAGSGVVEEEGGGTAGLLAEESVVLRGFASTRNEAITEAGELLVDVGAVDPSYLSSMHEREESVSTHMGNGLAIPHGTNDAKSAIRRTAISFVRYPSGIDWNGHQVKFVIGIASAGDDHLALLSKIGKVFVDRDAVAQLEAASSVEEVRRILGQVSTAGTGS